MLSGHTKAAGTLGEILSERSREGEEVVRSV